MKLDRRWLRAPKAHGRIRAFLSRAWRVLMEGRPTPPVAADTAPAPKSTPIWTSLIRESTVAAARVPAGEDRAAAFKAVFGVPRPPPGIPDADKLWLAMDEALTPFFGFAQASNFGEGIGFLGFPYLAELMQRAEYRVIVETRAKEMTRKWIELEYGGDEPNQDKINELAEAIDKTFKLRDVFRQAMFSEGAFGRGQIYIDTGAGDKPNELTTRLIMSARKIKQGSPLSFKTIEPIWVYPDIYNANDPLDADFFKPVTWWVMGKKVHRSRLLMIVGRPMPDLLKANYTFAGLSLSQMAKPYVDNWLRARQSVSDLLHSFSIVVLKTVLGSTLQEGSDGAGLFKRMDFFNALRDNRGIMAIDKDTEDLVNLAVPLGTLDKLQAQAQEHQSAVAQTPLVKLLGITPTGLNASSDGEIRVFYDLIHSEQEANFTEPLTICIDFIQLWLWGKIDPNIRFKYVPLWEMDEAGEALIRKTEADIDAIYVEAGIVDQEEVRQRLAADPHSPYAGLDVTDLPDAAEPDEEKLPPTSGDPARFAEPRGQERSGV